MEAGICLQSIVPVRAEPSHKAEMVTQLLFGDLFRITEQESQWLKIRQSFDDYEGWLSISQVNLVSDKEFLSLAGSETPVTMDLVQILSDESGRSMVPVVIGSSLPGYHASGMDIVQDRYLYEGVTSGPYRFDGLNSVMEAGKFREQLTCDALLYLNAPYIWGGRSPFGLDCSGFMQMVFKLQGFKLRRDASQQASQGDVVSLVEEAEPGDLAFFDDADGNITHVGMLINHNRIIHCSGKVRIDTLDHEGIFNMKLQKYTHKLRLIKRMI